MGCAPSLGRSSPKAKNTAPSRDSSNDKHESARVPSSYRGSISNVSIDPELAQYLLPPPQLPMKIGHGVSKHLKNRQAIIFIFGGPGSMKGLVVEEMVSEFGFDVLTTEDIVLNYLPNKVANTVETTSEIQDLLKSDKTVLTLEWVLHMISARLSTSTCRRFLVDIVPNFSTILKGESFSKQDFEKEMISFERRHALLFALELSVPKDRIVQSTSGIMMRVERQKEKASAAAEEAQKKSKKKPKKKKKGDAEAEDPSQSIFASTSDEADSARLKKRNDLYLSCEQPFVKYFEKDQRIVTIDVMTHQKEHIQKRVKDMLIDLGFRPSSTNGLVILFVVNESQMEGLDLEYYRMTKTLLSNVVPQSSSDLPMSVTLRALRRHIDGLMTANHLVVLDWLDITSKRFQSEKKRHINFVEVRECYIDHFIKIKAASAADGGQQHKAYRKPFKAVAATADDVILFPAEIPTATCRTIAHLFGCDDSLSFDGDSETNNTLFEELMAKKALPSTLTDDSTTSNRSAACVSGRDVRVGTAARARNAAGGSGAQLVAESSGSVAGSNLRAVTPTRSEVSPSPVNGQTWLGVSGGASLEKRASTASFCSSSSPFQDSTSSSGGK